MQPKTIFNPNRRRLLKQAGGISTLAVSGMTIPGVALSATPSSDHLAIKHNPLGFNGERQDPVTGNYHLGKGCRVYNPKLMRFHGYDSMSPFGKGGTNGYAYCLGDPVNQRDPSGHFALLSILIGAIVGAVVGAAVSVAAEGIQMAINPDHKFDWKQVAIGAAIGFITGGIGIAASAPKAGAQLGLAIVKSSVAELVSVPISTVTALSMQPDASKGLQIFGKVLGFSLAIAGVGYGLKNAAQLGKTISKGRVFRKMSHWERNQKFNDKCITLREAVFTGGGIASGISSASAGIAFNTKGHLGKNSYNSDLAMRFFHYGSSISGALSGKSLNPIKNLKSDPGGYISGRFTDLSHVTGLVAVLFTEPGSDENRQWNTVSFLTGITSVYTLNAQNHLKHFNKQPLWEQYGVSERVWNNVKRYHDLDSHLLGF
ncbi:RHS repeat-associated core domain-containing protein [Vibrio sp. YMD68]|uniref:RHS repeat-associated core domain-containing protein n=1 Tax=Vibrio sp. YMD68 TaxID=3042300 RepID=UPI00249A3405|nr:RHS repeat-associated core domain-containing protein [Vibrio sp. YMD68]WGV98282.1 RHS repeat-associated core domain-containing protein [Vibrio sp. YMD68]